MGQGGIERLLAEGAQGAQPASMLAYAITPQHNLNGTGEVHLASADHHVVCAYRSTCLLTFFGQTPCRREKSACLGQPPVIGGPSEYTSDDGGVVILKNCAELSSLPGEADDKLRSQVFQLLILAVQHGYPCHVDECLQGTWAVKGRT